MAQEMVKHDGRKILESSVSAYREIHKIMMNKIISFYFISILQ
jgi:hypothetical protein